jgi:hypothetical protein
MSVCSQLGDILDRGTLVNIEAGSLLIDAPAGALSEADVERLRIAKPDIIRAVQLFDAIDDSGLEEVDPADVPACESCGRTFDVESVTQTTEIAWRCSHCDPSAAMRRRITSRWLADRQRILSRPQLRTKR